MSKKQQFILCACIAGAVLASITTYIRADTASNLPADSNPGDQLRVAVLGTPNTAIYLWNQAPELKFSLTRADSSSSDKLTWKVQDIDGVTTQSGSASVPAGSASWSYDVDLPVLPPGYYAINASLENSGLTLDAEGSRPAGLATFGVLTSIRPPESSRSDDARFGLQGTSFVTSGKVGQGDPYDPLYPVLGARWVNFSRSWKQLEPDQPGQYTPKVDPAQWSPTRYEAQDGLTLLTTVDGVPTWELAAPPDLTDAKALVTAASQQAYPPRDLSLYSQFLQKVGSEGAAMRAGAFPRQEHGYYQVTWEPDWHWKGTDDQFISMYASAYQGLHAGDPNAVVLGPTYGVLSVGIPTLQRLLPMGLAKSIDGLAMHAYYNNAGDYTNLEAPEDQGEIENCREMHHLVKEYLRPGAMLINTEWGLGYPKLPTYNDVTPQLLHQQAAYEIRGHIIVLGEGANATYFFYLADYPGEKGFGLCFNLTMPNPSYGAISVSPKPVFMAGATLTRVLDGTKTLGPLTTLNDKCYAYAFERGGTCVVAAWANTSDPRTISLPTTLADVKVIDMMGRTTIKHAINGVLALPIGSDPTYVFDVDSKKIALLPTVQRDN